MAINNVSILVHLMTPLPLLKLQACVTSINAVGTDIGPLYNTLGTDIGPFYNTVGTDIL